MFRTGTSLFMAAMISVAGLQIAHAAEAGADARVEMMEEQLRQQKEELARQSEQNQQILKLLQGLADKDKAPAAAPAPTAPAPAASAPAAPAPAAAPAPDAPAAKASAAPAQTADAQTAAIKKSDLKPGWRNSIYPLDRGADVTSLPQASVGSFVSTTSEHKFGDYVKPIGMEVKGKAILWRGQAFLVAEQAGNYVFALDVSGSTYGAIFVQGESLGRGTDQTVIGSAELEPGVYRVEVHVTSQMYFGKVGGGYHPGTSFSLRIKTPADDVLQPASKVLFVKK
ncbi:hypothetical protein AGMMS50256_14770 [Betaproteobacteria bacterium]|nr:hypothetical protein AGMMS50256_14770 [Betaproteobacteria bacterium]